MKTYGFIRRTSRVAVAALTTVGLLAVQVPVAHADLPAPSWWNNTVCDTAHYMGAYSLGTSYNGVTACGPRPIADGGADVTVHFFSGAWGEYEWECVELVMRYMYLAYGVNPYNAPGGKDVVGNYTGSTLTNVANNGTSLPSPGDILSESATATNAYGHTAVVTAVNVTNENGTVSVLQQNASADGSGSITVTNGILGSNVSGWLHKPSSGGQTSYNLRQFYVSGGAWTAFNVTAATGVHIVGDPYEDAGGGVWARDTNNDLRQFYVDSSTGFWTAFDVSNATGVHIASDISAGPSGEVARGTNNHLYQFYVNGSTGYWTAFDITNATGVTIAGDPYEYSDGSIWARDTVNHLRQFYVDSGTHLWVAPNPGAATGVTIASDPQAGPSGEVARDTNNHLRQFYVSNGSWTAFDVSTATGVSIAGNPLQDASGGMWSRDINNHLRQFYVDGSTHLWTAYDVSNATGVSILSDVNSGASGEIARDTNNHLRQFYVDSGTHLWVSPDPSSATRVPIQDNPVQGPGGIFAGS